MRRQAWRTRGRGWWTPRRSWCTRTDFTVRPGPDRRSGRLPVGNVYYYYYFSTKAAIADAVVERLSDGQAALRRRWERHDDPRERLAAFATMPKRDRGVLARSGCPIGSLGTELGKGSDPCTAGVGDLLAAWLEWLDAQFAAMCRADSAADARHLLAALQGASLLSHVLGDPRIVAAEADCMAAWVRSL